MDSESIKFYWQKGDEKKGFFDKKGFKILIF